MAKSPFTTAQLELLKEALGDTAAVALALALEKSRDLEARIKQLEARPAFDYTGTFEQGRSYRKGQGVTRGGSIWIALKDYPAAPGAPNSGWQLAVKRGKDAR